MENRTPVKNIATIDTETFAAGFGVKPATVRHALCQRGHYLGIRPLKLPNRLLRWPADAAAKVFADAGTPK